LLSDKLESGKENREGGDYKKGRPSLESTHLRLSMNSVRIKGVFQGKGKTRTDDGRTTSRKFCRTNPQQKDKKKE